MNITLAALTQQKEKLFPLFVLLIGIAGAFHSFTISYVSHSNVFIGLMLLPFTLFINGRQRNNYTYFFIVLFFGGVALIYNVRIFYFFALAFYTLWIIELFIGRCNPLILFLFFFMSPFFSQVAAILGFPLRMQLSYLAGTILDKAGLDIGIEGNMMLMDGAVFSVDEACMGLNMLALSMLMGTFIIAHRYRSAGRQLSFVKLLLFFTIVFVLNIVTNLMRIIVLVLFRIPPENGLHDFIGLLCIAIYVIIPAYFISAWIMKKYANVPGSHSEKIIFNPWRKLLLVAFALTIFTVGVKVGKHRLTRVADHAEVSYPNVKHENLNDGISKLANEKFLLYVKPIPEFFSGEHTPLICWKGSGYEFQAIKEIIVEGKTIYSGKLVRGEEALYTAWWYSNGQIQTIRQMDWRLRMLKGENKFCLVNITSGDEETLIHSISSIFSSNQLRIK